VVEARSSIPGVPGVASDDARVATSSPGPGTPTGPACGSFFPSLRGVAASWEKSERRAGLGNGASPGVGTRAVMGTGGGVLVA
jgi:hypothetical protein